MKEIKHVAIYLRLSRDEEGVGIEKILANHRKKLIELCKRNKWTYTVYEEIASSQDLDRPQLNAMLDEIKKEIYDAVVVHAVDRLSREKLNAAYIQNVLRKNDCFLVTPEKIFDWENDEDNLLIDMLELVAKAEYRNIRRRLMTGKSSSSKQGHWINGIPPLGYDKNPETKKLEANDKAEHVRYIFKSIVEGKNITALYTELNNMGVKTRTNSSFTFNAVYRIVTNETYKGTIISNRTIGKHQGTRPKSEWNIVEDAHESIIDDETWEKANKIVSAYYFTAPRGKNKTYPTTKLIYCGVCGKVQGTQTAHTGKVYLKMCRYCYNRTYQYKPVLIAIKEELSVHLQKVIDTIFEMETTRINNDSEYKLKQLEGQIRKITKALNNIEILFEESEITLQQYRERKKKRNEELEQLNQTYEKLKQETPEDKIADLKEMANKVEYLIGNWEFVDGEGLTDEEVNIALNFIIERIDWYFAKEDEEPTMKITWR